MIILRLLVLWSISIDYSLTNKRKTAIFDGFMLFWAFVGNFFLSSLKILIYSIHLFTDLSPFEITPFKTIPNFFWFLIAQSKFLTELRSPIFAVHFSFATFFQYLSFVRFSSCSNLKFSSGCNLQWWRSFVDIFFRLWEIRKQTLRTLEKRL